jgi:hypothetical protein
MNDALIPMDEWCGSTKLAVGQPIKTKSSGARRSRPAGEVDVVKQSVFKFCTGEVFFHLTSPLMDESLKP